MIRFGVVDKIIPKGFQGGITTASKVTIREFLYNCTYTYLNLNGVVKIENINGIVEKCKAVTNP